jgi:hypothetical protein
MNENFLRENIIDLINMIEAIPCTCGSVYKDTKFISPDCPKCNWINDSIVDRIKSYL